MSSQLIHNSMDILSSHLRELGHSSIGLQWNELQVCKESITLKSRRCLPVGRPISNAEVYILDDNLQLSPIGVPGEVYIGGLVLARGYLNQSELTSERFIPHPFHQQPSSQIYRTGDLARYLPDGNIEYLGRVDHQVKIRGFRVETGEIESVLMQNSGVRKAVVVERQEGSGQKRLVAYIEMQDQELGLIQGKKQSITHQLRRYLQEYLPDYMVPSALVILPQIPLTPNGKINRKALPEPEVSLDSDFLLPRDHTEKQLAQIWADILNVKPIGIQDNFFELGGHSLLAVSLMAEIESHFGKNLPLSTLFQAQNIQKLANILRESDSDSGTSWSLLVPIQPRGSKPPFFCLPGGGGNVIYFSYLARYLESEQPFYALQAAGLDGQSEPEISIEKMAARYIEHIQSLQPHGPYFLGGHSFGGHVVFEIAQQLLKKGEEIALLAIFDTNAPQSENKMRKMTRNWDDTMWSAFFIRVIEHLFQKDLGVTYEELCELDSEQQLQRIYECLQAVNIYPPGAGLQQIRGFFRVFRANNLFTYFPDTIQPTQITLFQAQEDYPEQILCGMSFDDIKPDNMNDPLWGWDAISSGPVEVHHVPGDHITMLNEPHVKVLAQKLNQCLEKAHSRTKGQ